MQKSFLINFVFCWCVFFTTQHNLVANPLRGILDQSIPDLILKTVNQQINGTFKAQKLDFVPPSTVLLEQVSLLDTNNQPVITIDKASLKISLLSLFIGKIKADTILAENVQVNLLTENEILNIERIFAKKKPNQKAIQLPYIELSAIQLKNGNLNWQDEVKQFNFKNIFGIGYIYIEPSRIQINVNSLTANNGFVHFSNKNFDLDNVKIKNVAYKNKLVQWESISTYVNQLPIKAKGTLRFSPFFASLTTQLNEIEIFDTYIKESNLHIEADQDLIKINKGNLRLSDKSLISPQGIYDLKTQQLSLKAGVQNLDFETLKKTFGIDFDAKTKISGQLSIIGVLKENKPLHIKADANVESLEISQFLIPPSMFSLDLLVIPKQSIEFKDTLLKNKNLALKIDGFLDLENKKTDLSFNINSQNPHMLYKDSPKDILIHELSATGSLTGPFKSNQISSQVHIKTFKKGDWLAKNLISTLHANEQAIYFDKISSKIGSGKLNGHLSVGFTGKNKIAGIIQVANLSLNQMPLPQELRSVKGLITAKAKIKGTLKNPEIKATSRLSNLNIKPLFFSKVNADLIYLNNKLLIQNLDATLPYGSMSTDLFILDFSKNTIQSEFIIRQLVLSGISQLTDNHLSGLASGVIKISHQINRPMINGYFKLNDLSWNNQPLGHGKTYVWYNANNENLLQMSGDFSQNDEVIKYRSTLSLAEQKIRAEILLNNLSILPWTSLPQSFTMPLQGKVSGQILIDGSMHLPNITASIKIPDLKRQENVLSIDKNIAIEKNWVTEGSVSIILSLFEKQLKASLCGLSRISHGDICNEDNRLSLEINGILESIHNFDLAITGMFNVSQLDNWVRFFKKEFSSIDAHAQITTYINKTSAQDPIHFGGQADLKSAKISLPGIKPIHLSAETQIDFNNHKLNFIKPAIFLFDKGDLIVDGLISKQKFDFLLKGHIPLIISKYFIPFFPHAEGLALGELHVQGSPQYPLLNGYLIPDPGSILKPNHILDNITFNSGQINLNSHFTQKKLSLSFDHLNMTIGEGHALINGDVTINKAYDPKSNHFATWNLQLAGNEIMIRADRNWVETNFALNLETQGNIDRLLGEVNISDGFFYKKFIFADFILSAPKTTLPYLPDWLWPLKLDVQLLVTSFNAQTQMSAFFLDSYLTADMKLVGSVESPRVIGSMEITEGILRFPLLSFEIPTTSIPFHNTPGKFIDPTINIDAFADLPQKRFNLSQDTNIQLSLVGNLNEMKLDLKTLSGDKDLDRSQLLLMLLGSSNIGVDTVEDLFSNFTKTRILVGSSIQGEGIATQVRWQLSPRLEIAGSTRTTSTNVDLQNVILKLMIFDHLPFAKQLFWESSLFSPAPENIDMRLREDVRLKLRFLEQ